MTMAAAASRDELAADLARPASRQRRRHVGDLGDWWIFTLCLALSVAVLRNLWRSPNDLIEGGGDQEFFAMWFEWAAYCVQNLVNPLMFPFAGVPVEVNGMANTSSLGIGIPLAPVTIAFGPRATLLVAATIGFAGGAFGWYLVFRKLVGSRGAALAGGLACGFAPGMVSQTMGHPNFSVAFLLPLIALQLWKLVERSRPGRDAAILALLVVWQVFIGEEMLFVFAIALAFFCGVYALLRPEQCRAAAARALPGLVGGIAIAAALLAYPLWLQFAGPGAFEGIPWVNLTDLNAFTSFPRQTLANGAAELVGGRPPRNEENSYWGWPLLAAAAVAVCALRRNPVVVAAAAAAGALMLLALGGSIRVAGAETEVALPWQVVSHWPLVGQALPSRFGLAATFALATVLVVAADRALRSRSDRAMLWLAAAAAACAPLVPTPIPTVPFPELPQFWQAERWREFADEDTVLSSVPVSSSGYQDLARYMVYSDLEFRMVGGYFIAPNEAGRGRFGHPARPTQELLDEVAKTGKVPAISEKHREQARIDAEYWQVDAFVLDDARRNQRALARAMAELYGFDGVRVDEVTVWRMGKAR
jgi:hypothetical protein